MIECDKTQMYSSGGLRCGAHKGTLFRLTQQKRGVRYMYCENCGKELAGDGKFCVQCGAPIPEASNVTPQKIANALVGAVKKRWKLLVIAAPVLALVLVGISIADRISRTLDPRDYVTVTVTGFDGNGKLEYEFDTEEELLMMLMDTQAGESGSGLELITSVWVLQNDLYEAVQIEAVYEDAENGMLSNGDQVKLILTVDKEYPKQFGYFFGKDTYELSYKIGEDFEKLPEAVTIDLFGHFYLEIAGSEGEGVLVNRETIMTIPLDKPLGEVAAIQITVAPPDGTWADYIEVALLDEAEQKCHWVNVNLKADQRTGFSNGESVRVYFEPGDYLKKYGVNFASFEKTIVAENLGEPVPVDLLSGVSFRFYGSDGYGEYEWEENTYSVEVPGKRYEITATVTKYNDDNVYINYEILDKSTDKSYYCKFLASADWTPSLSNGDTLSYAIRSSTSYTGAVKLLNSFGLVPVETGACEVSGLAEPTGLDILGNINYTINQISEESVDITFGEEKIIPVSDNGFGITEVSVKVAAAAATYNWGDYKEAVIKFNLTNAQGITEEVELRLDFHYYPVTDTSTGLGVCFTISENDAATLLQYGLSANSYQMTIEVENQTESDGSTVSTDSAA